MRGFADVLRELRGGALYDELTGELAELAATCTDFGKAGTLTLTVSVVPNGAASVKLKGEVKVRSPRPTVAENIFFVGEEGHLTRNDPRQEEMPFGRPRRAGAGGRDDDDRLEAAGA